MNETKRRGWIKNAVIIFLVVLLVLTLFSNTIMNYSLPEVAVQYPQYATIASRIRQTGTVTANQSYDVAIEQTRTVASVEVRVGSTIKKGDVIFKLEEGDSAELDQANQELSNLNIQLIQKMKQDPSLNTGKSSSTVDDLKKQLTRAYTALNTAKDDLAYAEKDLAKVQEQQNKLPSYDELMNAKSLLSQIDTNIEYLDEEIKRLQGKQGQIGGDGYFTPEEIENLIAAAEKTVKQKEQAYTYAALAYDRAVTQQKKLEAELKAANEALKNAQDAVAEQNNNVSGGSTSTDVLMKEMQALQQMKNDLSALQSELSVFKGGASYRAAVSSAQSDVSTISARITKLQSDLSYVERQLGDYRPQLSTKPELQTTIDTLENQKKTYDAQLDTANSELTAANQKLANAQSALDSYYSGKGYYSMTYSSESAYNQAINEKTIAYNAANQEYQKTYFNYLQSSQQNSILEQLTAAQKSAEDQVEAVTESLEAAKTSATEKETAYKDAEKALDEAKAELEKTTGYREYDTLGASIKELQKQLDDMKLQKTEAETLIDSVSDDSKSALEEKLRDKQAIVNNAKDKVTDAQSDITDLQDQIKKAEAQAEVDDQNAKLDAKQYEIELQQIKDQIEAKQAEIARLEENRTDGTVVSPVSGVVESLSVSAGQEAKANTPIATIILSDMGYTMQCTVTAEQASKVSVGDVAEIQWYYWGTAPTARVVSIKSDAASQGQNKIIVLDVTGDITPGTSLTFTLGSKNTSYDCVVPNSAVREDANGKFVLVVTAKSTPLGNRYSAKRVDVEVLASDETNSAVSGAISGEYVITNSNQPISSGMNVRLSED